MPRLRIADRMLLRLMAPRMALALAVALAALLLERLLRLMDFAAAHGSPLGPILAMAVNLVPHYLGLALPVAFGFAVIAALSRMASGNELDALEGAGWSLRRIAVPVIACAAAMSVASLLLFGAAQPYGRYAYHVMRERVLTAVWDGRVERGVFIEAGDGLLLSADSVEGGRGLRRVVVLRKEEDDGPTGARGAGWTAVSAERGAVISDPDRRTLHLLLENGRVLPPGGTEVSFDRLVLGRELGPPGGPFRPRGENERELTFSELWTEMRAPGAEPRFATEFHDRLVRAASMLGVALFAAPLGVSRKRSPAWPRIALAAVILAVYDNLLKSVSAMADLGRVDPAAGLWGLALLFNGAALWLYLATPSQGSDGPLRRLLRALDRGRVRHPTPAGPPA